MKIHDAPPREAVAGGSTSVFFPSCFAMARAWELVKEVAASPHPAVKAIRTHTFVKLNTQGEQMFTDGINVYRLNHPT